MATDVLFWYCLDTVWHYLNTFFLFFCFLFFVLFWYCLDSGTV